MRLYIIESGDVGRFHHIEHPEDLVVNGREGVSHAIGALLAAHSAVKRGKTKSGSSRIFAKYDGAPLIHAGRDPKTGRPFIATKSAFNKDPKIDYTHADIAKHHGHGEKAQKLHTALKYLPGALPKKGIFAGELLGTHRDVKHSESGVSVRPNTVTYGADRDSPEGKRIAGSKLSFVPHTQYVGSSLEKSKPKTITNFRAFKDQGGVNMVVPKARAAKLSKHEDQGVRFHLDRAKRIEKSLTPEFHGAVGKHEIAFKSYINKTVRTGEDPTVNGFRAHLRNAGMSEIRGVKTPAGKQKYRDKLISTLRDVKSNTGHFETAIRLHHHLRAAKHAIMSSLSPATPLKTSLEGQPSKHGEGYVVKHNGRLLKLVDRGEFSRANFAMWGKGKKDQSGQ